MHHFRLQCGEDLNEDGLRTDILASADIDWMTTVDLKGRKSLHCDKRSDFHENENEDSIRTFLHRLVYLNCRTNATTFLGETLRVVKYLILFPTLRDIFEVSHCRLTSIIMIAGKIAERHLLDVVCFPQGTCRPVRAVRPTLAE